MSIWLGYVVQTFGQAFWSFPCGCSFIPLFCGWGERFSFKLVASEGSRVPATIWADLMQLIERFGEERMTPASPSQGSCGGFLQMTSFAFDCYMGSLDISGMIASPMTPVNALYSGKFLF